MENKLHFMGNAIVIARENVNADTAMCWSLGVDSLTPAEQAKLFMKGVDPTIAERAKKDDILVCGKNFGFGKTHMLLFTAMKEIGIKCIVAESFATQIIQTCMNIPGGSTMLVECPNIVQAVADGDLIEVDPETATVRNLTQGTEIVGKPFPPYTYNVMKNGGYFANLYRELMMKRAAAQTAER